MCATNILQRYKEHFTSSMNKLGVAIDKLKRQGMMVFVAIKGEPEKTTQVIEPCACRGPNARLKATGK